MAREALTLCSPARIPFAGEFLGGSDQGPGSLTSLRARQALCASPELEAPQLLPAPALGPPQPLAASPQPRFRGGPAGTPSRARCPASAPPAPSRAPGSDRVVVGVPQADGVREEAAGEVQRHALHVADGAHPGPGAGQERMRAGNGGSGAGTEPAAAPGARRSNTHREWMDTRTDRRGWFTKSVL